VRELTFTTARDHYIADELANKANKEHMGEPVGEEANKIQDQNQDSGRRSNDVSRRSTWNGSSDPCKACVSKAHGFDVCKFKNATCHRCLRKDHIHPVSKARLPENSFPSNLVPRAFSLKVGGAGKGPGIGWSRVHLTP